MSFIYLRKVSDYYFFEYCLYSNQTYIGPSHYLCFLTSVSYFLSFFLYTICNNFFKSVLGNILFDLPIQFKILMKIFSICRSFIWFFFKSACSYFLFSPARSSLGVHVFLKTFYIWLFSILILRIVMFQICMGPNLFYSC